MRKTKKIEFRLTEEERNRVEILASIYAGGNVSAWGRYALLTAPRRKLKKPRRFRDGDEA